MSVDALIHHPLAVGIVMQRPLRWQCRTPVAGSGEYALEPKPHADLAFATPEEVHDLCTGWLRRRRVSVQCAWYGVIDPERKKIWVVDMVGERGGRPILIVVYFTHRRRGAAWADMQAYTEALRAVCRRVYRIECATALINVYGAGRAMGQIVSGGLFLAG